MKKDGSFYWRLFQATFALSAFTFGGGYVIVPLMRERFVNHYHWIEEEEMLDIVAISQSAPGPMAVNASILVGYRLAGLGGAAATILGTVLPPFFIITVVSMFYQAFQQSFVINTLLRGMSVGVAAVVMNVVLGMARGVAQDREPIPILLMAAAFVASFFFKVNVVIILAVCATVGLVQALRAPAPQEPANGPAAEAAEETAPEGKEEAAE